MKQVDKISISELKEMSEKMFDPLVKAVVDLRQKKVVFDAEMHVDEEQLLLENGSRQEDLWGINLYPSKFGTSDFIEYDSMINIRPRQQNPSRSVVSAQIKQDIADLISEVVHE